MIMRTNFAPKGGQTCLEIEAETGAFEAKLPSGDT